MRGKRGEEVKGREAVQTPISYGGTAPMRGYRENIVRKTRRDNSRVRGED